MDLILFSFSEEGNLLGDRLLNLKNHRVKHYKSRNNKGKLKDIIEDNWEEVDGFIFIGATGIAVRYISPHVRSKTTDPAILVIDDLGRFVISLLSGHLGGANELALEISSFLKSIPVITTASDNRGIEAVDMFSKKNNYYMESMNDVKELTALMVDNKKIGFYSEEGKIIAYNNLKQLDSLEELDGELEGLILVTSRESVKNRDFKIPRAILRPRNINIGIGCRRGVAFERIERAVMDCLESLDISPRSLRMLGTVDVKKDEEGILKLASELDLELRIFSREEISKVEDKFQGSDFVKKTIGVSCVSEPAAYLMGREMLVLKSIHEGITISVSRGGDNE